MGRFFRYVLVILLIFGAVVLGIYLYRTFFGSSTTPGVAVGKNALMDCNIDCKNYGQCGVTMDEEKRTVVLGNKEAPTLNRDLHNTYFLDGVQVRVINEANGTAKVYTYDASTDKSMQPTAEQLQNAREETVHFWQVEQVNETGAVEAAGWVSDWCVKAPENE